MKEIYKTLSKHKKEFFYAFLILYVLSIAIIAIGSEGISFQRATTTFIDVALKVAFLAIIIAIVRVFREKNNSIN